MNAALGDYLAENPRKQNSRTENAGCSRGSKAARKAREMTRRKGRLILQEYPETNARLPGKRPSII